MTVSVPIAMRSIDRYSAGRPAPLAALSSPHPSSVRVPDHANQRGEQVHNPTYQHVRVQNDRLTVSRLRARSRAMKKRVVQAGEFEVVDEDKK